MDAGIAARAQAPGPDAGVAEVRLHQKRFAPHDGCRDVEGSDFATAFRRAVTIFEPAPKQSRRVSQSLALQRFAIQVQEFVEVCRSSQGDMAVAEPELHARLPQGAARLQK